MTHIFPIRIYYEDTDAGGVVYHANYLNFAERARTEFLRELGFENSTVREKYNVIFVVRHLEAHYFKPARLDDFVDVQTRIMELKRSSFVMNQRIVYDEEIIFDMMVALVCVDSDSVQPVRLPEEIRSIFEKEVAIDE